MGFFWVWGDLRFWGLGCRALVIYVGVILGLYVDQHTRGGRLGLKARCAVQRTYRVEGLSVPNDFFLRSTS